ncbi:MAG TPA: carboxypeptidase-like regulatory domain-containing protein [Gemmataceae bacterium]|nr:carboxypeptidase-like regulatory domain-containing protein [Gemmataceae bacterium]
MMLKRAVGVIAICVCMLALFGCDGRPHGTVRGTITLNGQPIELGAIAFIPADGQGPTTGGAIKDGKYSVANVPVGEMKVSISASKTIGKKKLYEDRPDSPEMPITENPVPEKYTSLEKTELRLNVKSGINEKNWELNSP